MKKLIIKGRAGSSLVEYGLILAVISVVGISAVSGVGNSVSQSLLNTAAKVSGDAASGPPAPWPGTNFLNLFPAREDCWHVAEGSSSDDIYWDSPEITGIDCFKFVNGLHREMKINNGPATDRVSMFLDVGEGYYMTGAGNDKTVYASAVVAGNVIIGLEHGDDDFYFENYNLADVSWRGYHNGRAYVDTPEGATVILQDYLNYERVHFKDTTLTTGDLRATTLAATSTSVTVPPPRGFTHGGQVWGGASAGARPGGMPTYTEANTHDDTFKPKFSGGCVDNYGTSVAVAPGDNPGMSCFAFFNGGGDILERGGVSRDHQVMVEDKDHFTFVDGPQNDQVILRDDPVWTGAQLELIMGDGFDEFWAPAFQISDASFSTGGGGEMVITLGPNTVYVPGQTSVGPLDNACFSDGCLDVTQMWAAKTP